MKWPSPAFRHHRVLVSSAPASVPAIRVVRREESRRSYSLSSASAAHDPAHHSTDAFSAPRMLTPLGLSGTSWSFDRTLSTSDVPLSLSGTPDPASLPSDALPPIRSLRMVLECFDLGAEGPCVAPPVKARPAQARERLPSYYEPASRNPQARPFWQT